MSEASGKWWSVYAEDNQSTVICRVCLEMAHTSYPCTMDKWEKLMDRFAHEHWSCIQKVNKLGALAFARTEKR